MTHKIGDGWASRRWRDGERLYVENDFVTMVYVATEDESKHGLGLHGEDQMCVIYISPAAAAPWASCVTNGES
jgi:hypothetical protein